MTRVFTVRLVRPVFQSVTIEVQALNRNSAMSKALRRAMALPKSDWKDRKTDDSDYTVDVESVLDHQIIYDTSANPHKQIREFQSGEKNSDTIKYLILAADLSARAGWLLSQPWFTGAEKLLQADLCSDWAEPISFILENDGLGDDGQHTVVGWETSRNDNVIDFPISDFDQELIESKS